MVRTLDARTLADLRAAAESTGDLTPAAVARRAADDFRAGRVVRLEGMRFSRAEAVWFVAAHDRQEARV